MYFIGIDLAWSEKNNSGIAVLESQKDTARFICGASDIQKTSDILDFILTEIKDNPAFIAIDASLIVNNETGERKPGTFTEFTP
jgi:predicted RNase H-like nuclease